MLKHLLLPCCLMLALNSDAHNYCRDQRLKQTAHKGTTASPFEDQYDVKYVKIDVSLDNTNTTVSGNTTTIAKVVDAAGMNQYAFELNNNLTVDSVKVDGVSPTFLLTSTNVISATLTAPLALNASFTAQVWYHGAAANGGTGFFAGGIVQRTLASGTNITYTMSDDYFAKDWWACKQSLLDKIDSVDIWVTAPANTRVGSNGVLQNITPIGTHNRFEWKTKYPIDYYLISASVAPYWDHTKWMHFSNSTDSMPVVHYIYDTVSFNPPNLSAMDSTGYMIDHFSNLFGRYPFWKEKYGHCTAPLGGGMEHQTMTTLGSYATPLIAHELGHQWWGDCITYSSWRDIWMSEGWASYCEQLYVEHFWSAAAAQTYRTNIFNRVQSQVGGTVYVYDTSNVLRTFDSRLTYDKGAAVAHMLRFVAPSDAAYFDGLKAYQQQYAFKTATTEDFKAVMAQTYGQNLDTFFDQWVYKEGYPTYTPKWNQASNIVLIQLTQATSKPASVPLFYTPLEIKLQSATGDTIVKIYNNAPQQLVAFSWNRTMTGLVIDPNNNILNKAVAAVKDPSLAVSPIASGNLRVYPNPARDSWMVTGIAPNTILRLYNATGQLVWQSGTAKDAIAIPAAALLPGNYQLVIQNGKTKRTEKLLKW